MDKRTAWMSLIFTLCIILGLGGMYYGQAERINVLQREAKEKDKQIHTLGKQIAQSQLQIKQQQQNIDQLQQKMAGQQKMLEEVKKNANF